MAPVQKGDIISFTLDNKREITVTWSQSLSTISEAYYAIPAKNTSRVWALPTKLKLRVMTFKFGRTILGN
ncbi:hypothetical protein K435DRAFT_849611 [Dendrothele bispora CBS 962.96]|uniref:Uncharacterized protein n=1 Tax=Dendrothele bispora (strain CBS 962.96) TaxID=1314807 RepID=A0A4S8MTZ6_DENBC|nr:hypothetical protein K435DRAFT_849611 [Dendrothele bispora CBS 962.96]